MFVNIILLFEKKGGGKRPMCHVWSVNGDVGVSVLHSQPIATLYLLPKKWKVLSEKDR